MILCEIQKSKQSKLVREGHQKQLDTCHDEGAIPTNPTTTKKRVEAMVMIGARIEMRHYVT